MRRQALSNCKWSRLPPPAKNRVRGFRVASEFVDFKFGEQNNIEGPINHGKYDTRFYPRLRFNAAEWGRLDWERVVTSGRIARAK